MVGVPTKIFQTIFVLCSVLLLDVITVIENMKSELLTANLLRKNIFFVFND